MGAKSTTIIEKFYKELTEHMENREEISIKQICSWFPEIKSKTISWRIHELVEQGKLQKYRA